MAAIDDAERKDREKELRQLLADQARCQNRGDMSLYAGFEPRIQQLIRLIADPPFKT